MAAPGDVILAGVSGGADSVCLLLLLLAYGERVPLTLAVAHVNHGIREDAGEDARYVEELCGRYGLPFFLTEADMAGAAREEKCSQEDAGRRIRYRAFAEAAGKAGADRIAVAHNSNDNAETMLHHLFRGSGLKGLAGIAPVRRDRDSGTDIIHPILCLERQEVEDYLEAKGIPWRRDSTNEGDAYCRNRIRHHILPYAEAEIVRGAVGNMGRAAELLGETEAYLEMQTREAMEKCAAGQVRGEADRAAGRERAEVSGYRIDCGKFAECHPVLQKRMLFLMMKQLSPTGKDISFVHVRAVTELFERGENRGICLPMGIRAERQYGIVSLERPWDREEKAVYSALTEGFSVPLTEELFRHSLIVPLNSSEKLEFSAFFYKKAWEVHQNQYTKWFDYDKMKESPVIRFRRGGDFLTIAGRGGKIMHKSLKDYMIGEKIPRQIRDSIPVLAEGSHVLWLMGWRISEHYKIDGNTKRVLQVRFLRETDF